MKKILLKLNCLAFMKKTLENDDIQNIMDKIIFVLKKKINLEIREK